MAVAGGLMKSSLLRQLNGTTLMSCRTFHTTAAMYRRYVQGYSLRTKHSMPKVWKDDRGNRNPVIDYSYYTPGNPISGSVEYGDLPRNRKFEFDVESLAQAGGFRRFQKPYDTPKDADKSVLQLARDTFSTLSQSSEDDIMRFKLKDPEKKYELLTKTFNHFNHAVPNSILYMIETVGDVVRFYCTSVHVRTPYEELIRMSDQLPPNIHIQKEALRFHPETDQMFGGISAFPKSSNLVTGLYSSRKYAGFKAKKEFQPYDTYQYYRKRV